MTKLICQVTWKEAKSLFLQYMEKPDARLKLYSLVCLKREEKETVIDWVQSVAMYESQMKILEITLPGELWVSFAWSQIPAAERRIIGTKPTTLAGLETEVTKLDPRDLPVY